MTAGATLAVSSSLGLESTAANLAPPMSPQQALQKLKEGNQSFVRTVASTRSQTEAERVHLGQGQHPFASILSCADSRTTPEIVFHQGLGDLFVVRVAGNVAQQPERASLEYASAVLKSPLIVVMGHSACGAVAAAIDLSKGETFPGDIQELVSLIEPAVQSTKSAPGDWLTNATKQNVGRSMQKLVASTVLSGLVAAGSLKIVGAYYDVSSGVVTFL